MMLAQLIKLAGRIKQGGVNPEEDHLAGRRFQCANPACAICRPSEKSGLSWGGGSEKKEYYEGPINDVIERFEAVFDGRKRLSDGKVQEWRDEDETEKAQEEVQRVKKERGVELAKSVMEKEASQRRAAELRSRISEVKAEKLIAHKKLEELRSAEEASIAMVRLAAFSQCPPATSNPPSW